MNATRTNSKSWPGAGAHGRRLTFAIAAASLLAVLAVLVVLTLLAVLVVLAPPLAAQTPTRLWAAQTGPDQVTLVWDSIPGTAEYRVYLGVPGSTPAPAPVVRLGARTRRTVITGVERLSGGAYLTAVGASGRAIQQAPFNAVTPVTSFPPVTAPAEVSAEATSGTEVTVSWNPVPGATAYFIGRAVTGSGFRALCDLCSTATPFVDRNARSGLEHTYMVSAIFPNGTSRRVISNKVTPGGTDVAAANQTAISPTSLTTTTVAASPTTSTVTSTTSTTTHTATPVAISPTTPTTELGTSPAIAIATTIATNAGTTATTSPTSTQGAVSGVIADVAGTVAGRLDGVTPPVGVSASVAGPGAVRVTWQPSVTAGVTEYQVKRSVNSALLQVVTTWQVLNTVPASTLDYTDAFFPITMFASGPVSVSYSVVASKSGAYSPNAVTPVVIVQPPTTAPTPATNPAPTTCKLDYQRADNMWAPFGQPQGALGSESISLTPGQDKVFTTDWKYEKTRNDGSNYYGSHLRIATNSTTRTIRLQLRSLTLTGLIVWARTGTDTFWIRLDPGKTLQFQADLMEVFCEN